MGPSPQRPFHGQSPLLEDRGGFPGAAQGRRLLAESHEGLGDVDRTKAREYFWSREAIFRGGFSKQATEAEPGVEHDILSLKYFIQFALAKL